MAITYRGARKFGFSFKWHQPLRWGENPTLDALGAVSHLFASKRYDDDLAMNWMIRNTKFKRVESPHHEDVFEFDTEDDASTFRLMWL